jgi:hypothetical protein
MINSGTVRPGLSFQPHSPGLPQGHFGKSEDRTSCAVLPRRDTNTSEPVRESPQISLVAVLMVLCGLVWSRCVLSLKTNVSWISNATCGKVPRCAEWIEMGLAWSAFGERLRLWFRAFHHTSASWHPGLRDARVHTSGFDLPFETYMVHLNAIETRIVEVKANMPRNSNHSSLFHHATSWGMFRKPCLK